MAAYSVLLSSLANSNLTKIIYNISITKMDSWRGVAVFDLGCKKMSRDLPGLGFKAPELAEIKGIQEQKVKSKGINKGG